MKKNLWFAIGISMAIIGAYFLVEKILLKHNKTPELVFESEEFDKATQQAKLAVELEKSAQSYAFRGVSDATVERYARLSGAGYGLARQAYQ